MELSRNISNLVIGTSKEDDYFEGGKKTKTPVEDDSEEEQTGGFKFLPSKQAPAKTVYHKKIR